MTRPYSVLRGELKRIFLTSGARFLEERIVFFLHYKGPRAPAISYQLVSRRHAVGPDVVSFALTISRQGNF